MITGQAASVGIYRSLEQRANLPSSMTFETNGTQKLTEPFKQWVKDIPEEVFFSVSPKLFTVSGEKQTVILKVRDKEDDTSNSYDQVVQGSTDGDYSLDFKVENLRLFQGDYGVSVSVKLISKWNHSSIDLTYYIALEP